MNGAYGITNWSDDRAPIQKKCIERGGVEFFVGEKSIRVVGPPGCGSSLVFYGRRPDSKDLDHLFMLIRMGCDMQLAHTAQVNAEAYAARITNCMKGK